MEQYLPFIVTLLTVISNGLGGNVKEISDSYIKSKLITPAPFTFSIWSIIYLLLLYVTFINSKEIINTKTPFGTIFSLFIISAILNATWIQVWGKNLVLSSIILLLLALVLIIITYELNKTNVNKVLLVAFGIYTMWVIIASLLNFSTALIENNILDNKFMKNILLIILIILPFIIKNIFNKINMPMLLVIIWASFGLIMNKNDNNLFLAPIISSLLNMFI